MAANKRDKVEPLNPVEELDLKHEIRQINVAFKGLADLVGQTLQQNKVTSMEALTSSFVFQMPIISCSDPPSQVNASSLY